MEKLLSILLLLCLALPGRAQLPLNEDSYADSLVHMLQQERNDSIKARTNFLLIYYWQGRDTAKARYYLDQGRLLSRKYPYLEAVSYAHEGYFYYSADPEKSETAYRKADSLLRKFNIKEAFLARSNIWQNIAVIQQRKDNDPAFIEIMMTQAIPLARRAGDSAVLGSEYMGLGVAFMNTRQYDKAAMYLDLSVGLLKGAYAQPSRLVAAYARAGENYIYLERYTDARNVLDSMKKILEPYPGSELYAGYHLVEGMYFQHLKEYAKAVAAYDKGIAIAGGPNKAYRIQEMQILKTETLVAAGSYAAALQLSLSLSQQEAVMSLDENRLGIYAALAKSYAGLGNTGQAYQWQLQYSQLSDSMNDSRSKREVNAMEEKYRHAENQREILLLKAKNEQAGATARSNKMTARFLAALSLLLLIITMLSLLYYRNFRKLAAQRLKDAALQQQVDIGAAMLEGEERERRRLARDLHDGLGGLLSGVKINLSGATNKAGVTPVTRELNQVIHQLDHSVYELRRIARNLMPESLLRFGLETALKDLCEVMEPEGTHIRFEALGIGQDIAQPVQIAVYRIIQETLSNAVRHAAASEILVQCSQNEGVFFITVEDNGRGFDTAAAVQEGIGLANIRNRVAYLKGNLEITSAIGEGTTINIEVKC